MPSDLLELRKFVSTNPYFTPVSPTLIYYSCSSHCVSGGDTLRLTSTHFPSSNLSPFFLLCIELQNMAQILAPSTQWQMRFTKSSHHASPITSNTWSSLLMKQNKKTSSAKFRVLAVKSDGSTINRLEGLLNLDITPFTDKIIAEYIWIGGTGIDVRSKSRTISKPVEHPSELPKWNYDGSSTGQAPGEDSEVILYPQAIFKDPFRGGNNILVICDAYTPAGEPIPTNKRHRAAEVFSNPRVIAEVPWFGIEQEYTLLQTNVNWPLGWPVGGYPGPQGPYYCSAGADKSFGRDISDAHYKACLFAGINISGTNGEVMPGQWEYQVGPSVGIEAGDHIWASRYILERITEQAGVVLSLDPKPIEGDWNGAGCHTNYSTKSMREDGGFEVIKKAILNLSLRHKEHISAYGEGNERRLTGKHETASINTFSWGVANRGCSIRVGRDTEKNGKGYLEDRRPASNMDPYVVTSLLAESTLLWEPTLEAEALAAQKLALKV